MRNEGFGAKTLFLYLAVLMALFALSGCGGCNVAAGEELTVSSDTMSVPEDEPEGLPQTMSFFVFDVNTNIFAGNTPETMDIMEDITGIKTAISHDGVRIAYVKPSPSPSSVYVYDRYEKDNRLLNFPSDAAVSDPVFSPDGKFLAVTIILNGDKTSKAALYDLRKDTFKIISRDNMPVFNPTFSPKGSKMVFHDMTKVFVYNFNGFNTKLLKTFGCEEFCMQNSSGISENSKFQISDDGNDIVYTYNCYSDTVVSSTVLARFNTETLLSEDLSPLNKYCTDFQTSQDGNIYCFLRRSAEDSSEVKLYVKTPSEKSVITYSSKIFDSPCSFSVSY
ncbi:MAG: PD40 domain-containing protein [Bacteroidales bacterium]|nr:PD40 domain-containing protein [Bacteroidales bacterium]